MSTNNKGLHIEGPIKKYLLLKNYSLSTWIANLGVVPFVLFWAFLLLPIFFNLLARRLRVTRVFETISPLLISKFIYGQINKFNYLSMQHENVKVLLISLLLFLPFSLQATEITGKTESLIISIGEHKEISVKSLSHYSISNKDAVSHRFVSKKKAFLIKGIKLGFSELVIWSDKKEKKVFKIYVIGKKQEMKLLQLAESFSSLNLQSKLLGTKLELSGDLNSISDYNDFQKLISENVQYLLLKVKLSARVQKELLNEVSLSLFNDYVDVFTCYFKNVFLNCDYDPSSTPSKSIINSLQKNWHVRIRSKRLVNPRKNLSLHLKLVQWERTDGKEINLGLDHLSTSLGEILFGNLSEIASKNLVSLQNHHLKISTLANPKIKIIPGESHQFSVGAEIPYKSDNQDGTRVITNFKFAGLKLHFKIRRQGNDFHLKYKTELSNPSVQGQVAGSKGEGSLFISQNKVTKAFEVSFKTIGKSITALPGLGQIPIIGKIFQGNSDLSNHKKIIALIYLEESNEN